MKGCCTGYGELFAKRKVKSVLCEYAIICIRVSRSVKGISEESLESDKFKF